MRRNEIEIRKELIAKVDAMGLAPSVHATAILLTKPFATALFKMISDELQSERLRKPEQA